jgi:hypothetical protein
MSENKPQSVEEAQERWKALHNEAWAEKEFQNIYRGLELAKDSLDNANLVEAGIWIERAALGTRLLVCRVYR